MSNIRGSIDRDHEINFRCYIILSSDRNTRYYLTYHWFSHNHHQNRDNRSWQVNYTLWWKKRYFGSMHVLPVSSMSKLPKCTPDVLFLSTTFSFSKMSLHYLMTYLEFNMFSNFYLKLNSSKHPEYMPNLSRSSFLTNPSTSSSKFQCS